MSEGETYKLLLSFKGAAFGPDPEHAFVRGFEAGGYFERLSGGRTMCVEGLALAELEPFYRRMGAALGWSVASTPTDGGDWVWLVFEKTRAAKDNPRGLHIVEDSKEDNK